MRVKFKELLEIRRRAHEAYLWRRHGYFWSLSIEGPHAVVRCGTSDVLTVRFPKRDLLRPDCMKRLGF
jgi:hypothetical protein